MRFQNLVISLLLSFQTVSFAAELPPIPGKRFDVGGYYLHIQCMGQGLPTVIIDTGLGDDSTAWQPVLKAASKKTKTCVYDRAGYGWSDEGPRPRTSLRISHELEQLVSQAKLSPPYLLVGHSFGGYNMRVFTARNPEQVAGLILVDASHEEQHDKLDIKLPRGGHQSNIVMLSTSHRDAFLGEKDQILRERAFRMASDELSSMFRSAQQVKRYKALPQIPLIVLSRGKAEWYENEQAKQREIKWIRMQQDLARLSPLSQHIFANYSGHDIHTEQPESIIDAIDNVIELSKVTE
jgi:pimeloyl-ACP methyl ester carboxylesterase